ncbi:MAG: hypothetical protein KC776_37665 [Myxococcales bacterium]|nr:hypothetical protein [Myxococcales bacterium]MCB9578286.1 hypothetical protein [Polyangiaceae bacterium]
MNKILPFAFVLVAAGFVGCGSGGDDGNAGVGGSAGAGGGSATGGRGGRVDGVIDCAWLEGPQNCWQAAVDEAYASCAVPSSTEGYFGDQYLSCAYPNGDTDVYGSNSHPLDAAGNGHDDFYVEATRGGTPCFTFEAPTPSLGGSSGVWTLTTKSGTVTYSYDSAGISIQCPNGSTFAASGVPFAMLFTCPTKQYPGGVEAIPFPGFAVSQSKFNFMPSSQNDKGDSLTNCTCAPPEPPDGGGLPPPAPGCPSI